MNDKYPARLVYATFYNCDKIAIERDETNHLVHIVLRGNDYQETRFTVFSHDLEVMPQVEIRERADADADADV